MAKGAGSDVLFEWQANMLLSHRVAQRIDATKSLRLGLAAFVLTVGCSVVMGWLLHVGRLKALLPGLATMKINTGLAMMSGGSAVALMTVSRASTRAVATALVSIMGLIGFLTLLEYAGFVIGDR